MVKGGGDDGQIYFPRLQFIQCLVCVVIKNIQFYLGVLLLKPVQSRLLFREHGHLRGAHIYVLMLFTKKLLQFFFPLD